MSPVLWRDLSPEAKHDYSSRFRRLHHEDIGTLNAEDFVLFAQWLCKEHSGASATTMTSCLGGFDFALRQSNGDNEFLRVYSEQGQAAAYTLYELLETLKGSSIKRIRIYQRHPLSSDAQRMRREFPLAFEVLDVEGLAGRLGDIQRAAARGGGAMLPIAKKRPPIQSKRKPDRIWIETALVVVVVIMFWVFIGLLALMAFENAMKG